MSEPTIRPKTRASKPKLPRDLAEAASRLLYHRGSARPTATMAWAVAAGMAAAPRRPSDAPGVSRLDINVDLWLNALFDDWALAGDPWPEPEAKAGLALLERMMMSQRALLPALPSFPARPTLTVATLDELWHHLDLVGWRALRFTLDPAVEPYLADGTPVGRLMHEGVELLTNFHMMCMKAFTDHAASALVFTEELAGLLHRLHAGLDQAAAAAGVDPLEWPVPDYTPFLAKVPALPPGPRGPVLPESLATDLQAALDDRRCSRPPSTALPMVQRYAAIQRGLDPGWIWSPSGDGRECAFILFESGLEEDLPDWTSAQARHLSQLCTSIHAWGENQPVPPLPPLAIDPADERAEALWLHQDLLFLAGSVLGMGLGVIPDPDDPAPLKRERRLRIQWMELQTMLWGAIHHWAAVPPGERAMLAETLPMALGAVYQAFRNEVARVDRAFLRFLPKPPENLLPRAKAAMVRFGRIKKR